jgi:hypothetical protein
MFSKLILERVDKMDIRMIQDSMKRFREIKLKWIIMISVLLVVAGGTIVYFSTISEAGTGEDVEYKYYKSITVPANATVWTIADEYMDPDHYASIEEYIKEVKHVNSLGDDDTLLSGQSLILPYYSPTFVQ